MLAFSLTLEKSCCRRVQVVTEGNKESNLENGGWINWIFCKQIIDEKSTAAVLEKVYKIIIGDWIAATRDT